MQLSIHFLSRLDVGDDVSQAAYRQLFLPTGEALILNARDACICIYEPNIRPSLLLIDSADSRTLVARNSSSL